MYIEPNTTIRILHGVPLDSSYKHTVYFGNPNDQENYFTAFKKGSDLTKQSYQRVGKGKCRINRKYEELYDCNYMMFRNDSFSTKWFYAFIKKIDYVNNTVSEIEYEIDVMQTWLFEYALTMQECFVEREHSETDEVGDNLVVEPVDVGDIVCGSMGGTNYFNDYVAVIASAYNDDTENVTGGYIGGLFTGLDYLAGVINNEEQVQLLLDYLKVVNEANDADSVVSIWVMPHDFYTKEAMPVVKVQKVEKPKKIGSHIPRNKKLLTYPYCYLGVDCGNNSAVYRYEYFNTEGDTNNCNFALSSCIAPNTEITLIPMDYNGAEMNYVEQLVMTGFPQVGWSTDSYRAWLAQEASATRMGVVASAGVGAISFASGNLMGAVGGTIGVMNGINEYVMASNRPAQARGNAGGSVDVAGRSKNYYFKFMRINEQYAKILDDFFDMYGYAVNRVKKPNITARPFWNYIKTSNFDFYASVPTDDKEIICANFNNGITFWKDRAEDRYIGKYSELVNSV